MIAALALLVLAAPDLGDEAKRRTDVLITQHYNLTQGFTLEAKPEKTVTRVEFFIPEENAEHSFSFWGEAATGTMTYRLFAPDGLRSTWSGRSGESTFTAAIATGRWVLEIEQPAASTGRAVFGVKGPVVKGCELEPALVQAAAPAKGFQWPYILYIPTKVTKQRLLVAPNNTGFLTSDVKLLQLSASCELKGHKALADRLGTPLLIPMFPRPRTLETEPALYLHALSRTSLETKVEAYRRVDLQLMAMMDDARAVLKARNIEVPPEAFFMGFSASASFVSRFAVLHPERCAAVVSFSPGGWPIAPVAKAGTDTLNYPVGVGDLEALTGKKVDTASFAKISWLFGIGGTDDNDSVPLRDSFSAEDEALIMKRFGKFPVPRWKPAEQLYKGAGLNAQFKVYPRVGHQVSEQMAEDRAVFFEKH